MERTDDTRSGPPEGPGYATPGYDSTLDSPSRVVPVPSTTGEERLSTPDSRIEGIQEEPGSANPALAETVGFEEGTASTAELLMAREMAEEERLRNAQAHIYQDQPPDKDTPLPGADTGQPAYPYKHQEDATPESMDSPDIQEGFEAATGGVGSLDLRARAERTVEKASEQTAYNDALAGQGPYGDQAQRLDISGAETPNTFVPGSDGVTDMKNIPIED